MVNKAKKEHTRYASKCIYFTKCLLYEKVDNYLVKVLANGYLPRNGILTITGTKDTIEEINVGRNVSNYEYCLRSSRVELIPFVNRSAHIKMF